MIVGIGTDIASVARFRDSLTHHGQRFAAKVLAESELKEFAATTDPARFVAKRWAAKEALGKALGCGIRAPLTLPSIAIEHDSLGKPMFRLSVAADALVSRRGWCAHVSISDEQDMVVAFVLVEEMS